MADDRRRDQQEQGHGIGRIGQIHPDADVDTGHGHQKDQADDEAHDLLVGPGREMAAGHRIEHRKADAGDHRDQQHQAPIDLEQLLADGERAAGGGVGPGDHARISILGPVVQAGGGDRIGRRQIGRVALLGEKQDVARHLHLIMGDGRAMLDDDGAGIARLDRRAHKR